MVHAGMMRSSKNTAVVPAIKRGALNILPALAMILFTMVQFTAFAESGGGSTTNALESIIKLIGKLLAIPGLLTMIVGIAKYADAHSDGDGPAQKKATNIISGGAMVLIVGVIIATSNWSAFLNGLSGFTIGS